VTSLLDGITNWKTTLDKLYGLVNLLIDLENTKRNKNENQRRLVTYLETIRIGLDAVIEEQESKKEKEKDNNNILKL
jgi:hypothetical protein